MKNVKPVLLLPDAFREKMAFHQINQVVLLQAYINKVKLFELMDAMHNYQFDQKVYDIRSGMLDFLKKGGKRGETALYDLCGMYLDRLTNLITGVTASRKKKNRKADQIILEWEQQVGHLLNYPRIIKVEDLGELHISFNYFVVCIYFRISLLDDLASFMEMAGTDEHEKRKKITLYQTDGD